MFFVGFSDVKQKFVLVCNQIHYNNKKNVFNMKDFSISDKLAPEA